jgi:hypothetical protein
MNDDTKRALATSAQAFVNSRGDAYKTAHAAVEEAKTAGQDVAAAEALLVADHTFANGKMTELVTLFTLSDGTQTVKPYDGEPK